MAHTLNPDLWLDKYGDYLYNYAISRVSDAETAEDLVQETFLSAFKSKDNFEGRASEKTWLASILKNKVIDHYRKTLIKDPEQSGKKETPMSFFSKDGSWQMDLAGHDWNTEASAALESAEFFKVFHNCVEGIKGKTNAAFTMKYLDEEESEEICKALEISPSNYWVMIHRAKIQLRDCLDKNWFHNI